MNKIKLLVMDVDGTLTDGKIHMGNKGELFKSFYCRDGLGIISLIENGVIPVILTARKSDIVEVRCKELGISQIYQGCKNKLEKLDFLIKYNNVNKEDIAYIGDDINDFEIMLDLNHTFAPVDCYPKILSAVKIHLSNKGGNGAVRECADWILEYNRKLEEL